MCKWKYLRIIEHEYWMNGNRKSGTIRGTYRRTGLLKQKLPTNGIAINLLPFHSISCSLNIIYNTFVWENLDARQGWV